MTYDPRFYRDAYGTGENILSMASGSIAEPVSGVAALLAAAQGYDARGARDAIREKMTYQPRSSAGVEQAQMLARLVQGVMESAPVRAWQRGVDIAGRYSPAAGAALQTVPTAIGVVAGYKPTMAQGRAASMLAEQMQKRMVQNAMAPRTLHPQAGVISIGDTPKRVMGDIAKKAYELGVKHRRAMLEDPSLTLMDVIYASDDADRALSDIIYKRGYELSSAAYESGRRGAKIPTLAKGLRYGIAPDSGFSMNKATGELEQGVSMARVDGVDYEWYPISDSKYKRTPINYEGYLLDPDYFWGGDGEPLMLKLREIDGK